MTRPNAWQPIESRKAVQTECPRRTTIGGTCLCQPKCVRCGWGAHMGVHMGTKADPALAYDHEYTPPAPTGAAPVEGE